VLERTLGWLGVSGGGYSAPSRAVVHHAAVRNAVSGQKIEIIAVVSGGGTPGATLTYRIHGSPQLVTVPMARGRNGAFQATIPASAVNVNGIDYVVSAGGGRSPASSELSHYISVGLPA
jgi:hypothetical protein